MLKSNWERAYGPIYIFFRVESTNGHEDLLKESVKKAILKKSHKRHIYIYTKTELAVWPKRLWITWYLRNRDPAMQDYKAMSKPIYTNTTIRHLSAIIKSYWHTTVVVTRSESSKVINPHQIHITHSKNPPIPMIMRMEMRVYEKSLKRKKSSYWDPATLIRSDDIIEDRKEQKNKCREKISPTPRKSIWNHREQITHKAEGNYISL